MDEEFFKKMMLNPKIEPRRHPDGTPMESVEQRPDGRWIWYDETWSEGDNHTYDTYEEACRAQGEYCVKVLGI